MRPLLALLLAAGLAGCGEFAPFETYAPPPEKGKVEAGPRVAVCRGPHNNAASVQAAAQALCPKNTLATPAGTDLSMQDCPLLLPQRALFVCAPNK